MTKRFLFRYFKTSPARWAAGDLPPCKQTLVRQVQINPGPPKILNQGDQLMGIRVWRNVRHTTAKHAKFKLLEELTLIYH